MVDVAFFSNLYLVWKKQGEKHCAPPGVTLYDGRQNRQIEGRRKAGATFKKFAIDTEVSGNICWASLEKCANASFLFRDSVVYL